MSRSPKERRRLIVLSIAVLMLLVLSTWAWMFASARLRKQAGEQERPQPASQAEEEFDLELPAVSEERVGVLFCGLDDAAGLTDVLLYAQYDVGAGSLRVLQIPRDTYIGETYRTGKVNQVYFTHKREKEPVRALADLLEQQLQLPVDHYVLVTLNAFREAVDALGGVELNVDRRMEFLPGKVLEPGLQRLTGEQAEWFVRYRAGYKEGDIGRIKAQREMIAALLQAVKDKGRAGMLRLGMQQFGSIQTDLPLLQALSYANSAFRLQPENIEFYMLPGNGVMHGAYAVYEIDQDKLIALLNEHFRPEDAPVYWLPTARVPEPEASGSSEDLELEEQLELWDELFGEEPSDHPVDPGGPAEGFPID